MVDLAGLSTALRRQGMGWPGFIIDKTALSVNLERVLPRARAERLRLVLKSLPCPSLVDHLMHQADTTKLMVFHMPNLLAAARRWPNADLMLGKPLPAAAVDAFYRHFRADSGFDPTRQLHWLVDDAARVRSLAELAKAHGVRMSVVIELDVGMHRGGATDAKALIDVLAALGHVVPFLRLAGFMGYDAQAGRAPFWVGRKRAVKAANRRYREFLGLVQREAPALWPQQPLINGSGSPTCTDHDEGSPLNELAIGSVLVKPAEFDLPQLSAFQPACWIAAPLIKRMAGVRLPFLEALAPLSWRDTVFAYGGRWAARPEWPQGLRPSRLYGPSFNQQFFTVPRQSPVQVDDFIFFRPLQSEQLMRQFGMVTMVEQGQIVERWPVLDSFQNLALSGWGGSESAAEC